MHYPSDHGLPLVQLKERRREMVVALQSRVGPILNEELNQIAAIQQAISAFQDVIADLDYEAEMGWEAAERSGHAFPAIGRRGLVHSPV
ncbi:hypothetical protein [Bradyrhizobium sp. WSM471]|uniref:hypothetical protein n=1 Tax=Bradyrhizobium sp. WSM471 TaxID=319017 RepID=UPI00024D22E3|nr:MULTISPECIES: hypothetical protein [Bradyrhizobium]EHR01412.1 hypothetical protein Bra471DRAFT_02139 [Bradyrhizobium sp. WSM471]UFW43470.1 hypothetical protein BcanWSM471_10500 [Bradyrhizobium canariense]